MPAPAPFVRFRAVCKRFGAQTAVDAVSLEIGRGEFFSLLGPSGCGKTTTLRLLAGLESPDSGEILLDGNPIGHLPAWERPLPTCCRTNVVGAQPELTSRSDCIMALGFGEASVQLFAHHPVTGDDGTQLYASDHNGLLAVFSIEDG